MHSSDEPSPHTALDVVSYAREALSKGAATAHLGRYAHLAEAHIFDAAKRVGSSIASAIRKVLLVNTCAATLVEAL